MVYDAAAFTDDWYLTLPELYRVADEADQGPGRSDHPLLRFLDLLGAQADEVQTLLEDIEAGKLTDPDLAQAGWLPWLAQLVGVRFRRPMTVAEQRAAINGAANGWSAGTRAAIKAAIPTVNVLSVGPLPDNTVAPPRPYVPWGIQIVVSMLDTSGLTDAEIIQQIIDAGAKPAGYFLQVVHDTIQWQGFASPDVPTFGETAWDDFLAPERWEDVESGWAGP